MNSNAFANHMTPHLALHKAGYCGKGYRQSLGYTLGSNLGGGGRNIVPNGLLRYVKVPYLTLILCH